MQTEYDVIVIGGGINGLTVAGYLARAGQKVAVFELRNEVGTNCETEEVMRPGVRANLHAVGVLPHAAPVYEELEMERFGYESCFADWGYGYPFKDGSCVLFHNYDAEKTYLAWKAINEKDAETYRRICNYYADHIVELVDELFYKAPNARSFSRGVEIMSRCPGMPPNWLKMTGYQLMDHLFEDDRIKLMMLSFCVELGVRPWDKSIGSQIALMFIFGGLVFAWMTTPKGGSHLIPHTLYRAALHYGAEVFQGCPVDKIIVENGEAKGVILSEDSVYPGHKIMARKAVVSDLTPIPTFFWLVGRENLPPEVVMHLEMYDYEEAVLFGPYLLTKEPLQFEAFNWTDRYIDSSVREQLYGLNIGAESVIDMQRYQRALARGELPDPPFLYGGIWRFTVLDPTQAPPGMHTTMLYTAVPYNIYWWGNRRLNGPGSWDDIREEYADRVEDFVAEYAPNIKTAKIDRYVQTPLDIVRRNPSMLEGTWSGGALGPSQYYHNRPFPGCGAPRTPIKKLYTTEVSFGRTTMLTQGYITASVVAEDLGVRNKPWWNVRPLEPYMRLLERRGKYWKMKF